MGAVEGGTGLGVLLRNITLFLLIFITNDSKQIEKRRNPFYFILLFVHLFANLGTRQIFQLVRLRNLTSFIYVLGFNNLGKKKTVYTKLIIAFIYIAMFAIFYSWAIHATLNARGMGIYPYQSIFGQ
ncbi:hypothetical protein FACS1894147_05730 [Spirochaetia bacterium]|nr:hypothetical protein FACS1894147_05730 [Spirochaetia bacterium]